MSNRTSEDLIQQFEQDVLLPGNLLSKQLTFSDQQDCKIQSEGPDLFQTQFTTNTSYTFEAVNGINHDHDKTKVDNRVTLEDNRDDEIQCGSHEQSKTQPSDSLYLPVFPSQLSLLI
jgi:hypothetical protein